MNPSLKVLAHHAETHTYQVDRDVHRGTEFLARYVVADMRKAISSLDALIDAAQVERRRMTDLAADVLAVGDMS
jgi:chromosomal replication initiation ATPase DnaA